eukprot:TRINITY_DN140_c0_g1_i1.p1 TRINITY_DN140_c0_g1~~TRINITY_DN140_c0_g1_i1.p1  ORF type:complete len:417 (+),score=98.37 TRINITY_DN140_c0_g1_i1:161-1411(+)
MLKAFGSRSFSRILSPVLKRTADFCVIGAGIVGANIAIQLKHEFPDAKVLIMEKESHFAEHASGRNSGVLHAGFYYTSDTLKAKFTREGNAHLTQFCEDRKLKLNKCGKLVVAKNEAEVETLDLLLQRGIANGVPDLEIITEKEALELQPGVKTVQKALWSPNTSSADPIEVTQAHIDYAKELGAEVMLDQCFVKNPDGTLKFSNCEVDCGYVVNAAGLYADKIAHQMDFGLDFKILPFKGLYHYLKTPHNLKRHIYPVPDLRNPFLGVHFTVTAHGDAKIGPTAIPAFWRENYSMTENFKFDEFIDINMSNLMMYFTQEKFRRLAHNEVLKYYRPKLANDAAKLLDNFSDKDLDKKGRPGIRSQLVNVKTKELVMDFYLENDEKSMHVLNAVSPAWTCSEPFARHTVSKIVEAVR